MRRSVAALQITKSRYKEKPPVSELFCQHKRLLEFTAEDAEKMELKVAADSFVAPSAMLSGNVEVWHKASVWYGAVVRGDETLVRVGYKSNVQDGTVVTEAFGHLADNHDGSTVIGHWVSVGKNCELRACTVEPESVVEDGCVLEEGSYMEKHTRLQAGSVLGRLTRVPHGELWGGAPAKKIRDLTPEEVPALKEEAQRHYLLSLEHKDEFSMPSDAYREAEELQYPIGYTRVD